MHSGNSPDNPKLNSLPDSSPPKRGTPTTPIRDDADLGEWLEREAFPALYQRLESALPEFAWRQSGPAKIATRCPAGFLEDVRASRITVYTNNPGNIIIQGHPSRPVVPILHLLNGGTRPGGQVFIDVCRKVADLAGIQFPERELSNGAGIAGTFSTPGLNCVGTHCGAPRREPQHLHICATSAG